MPRTSVLSTSGRNKFEASTNPDDLDLGRWTPSRAKALGNVSFDEFIRIIGMEEDLGADLNLGNQFAKAIDGYGYVLIGPNAVVTHK